MAAHSTAHSIESEITRLRPGNKMLGIVLMVVGLVAVLAAAGIYGFGATQRFFYAYLFGLCGFTAISCAALIFTIIGHLVRAGWIINVRRVLETVAVQLPLIGILTIPVVVTVVIENPVIYSWARPGDTPVAEHGEGEHGEAAATKGDLPNEAGVGAHHDEQKRVAADTRYEDMVSDAEVTGQKSEPLEDAGVRNVTYPNEQVQPGATREFDEILAHKNHGWLNPYYWTGRVVIYYLVLAAIAVWYYRSSVRQDASGDIDISQRLLQSAGPMLIAVGLIVTFIAVDVFMALDAHWFSTMYGIYFFASGTQAMWATMCLTFIILRSRGYLAASVSSEHLHDLGKWLWAFIFFFGYIAFSQYMLQWYANLPEETLFYDKRGYSTQQPNGYTPLVLVLVIGRFCIPFLGLVSRHVKRSRFGLGFWSVWLLVCFFVDIYLLVMPDFRYAHTFSEIPFGLPEILCLLGIGALWLGNTVRMLAGTELRPVRDPRTHESMAYANF